ncbi:hypothetical protein COV18_01435 [Candidatus Woesearchaeota archaeon CG10_big_fil_rev_8_21_14_0_10_37_12]|nr:MAG: hypothetical protein COV18_01435 [Candidatus Woesearchaeota archaeon CG10_big_fil_rev_8_21_14_0_10_37_12]
MNEQSLWQRLNAIVYWLLLILAIVGNFIVSVVLVPFLLMLKGWFLFASLFFIGLSFGWLFSFIIHSLEELEVQQKIIASVFIPCLALINVGMMAILANRLIEILNLTTPPHNAALVGAVYVLGYVIPDAAEHLRTKRE